MIEGVLSASKEKVIEKLSPEKYHNGRYITNHGDDWRFEHYEDCFMCAVIDIVMESK